MLASILMIVGAAVFLFGALLQYLESHAGPSHSNADRASSDAHSSRAPSGGRNKFNLEGEKVKVDDNTVIGSENEVIIRGRGDTSFSGNYFGKKKD